LWRFGVNESFYSKFSINSIEAKKKNMKMMSLRFTQDSWWNINFYIFGVGWWLVEL